MSKSTNTVVYFDWKMVIYIYICGKCHTQFMLPMEKSVTFTGACANAPFNKVEYVEDPNDALKIWYNLFNEILNKHAPIVTKRVKRDKQPEWYNTEVQYARQMRDKFKNLICGLNINSGEIEQSKY